MKLNLVVNRNKSKNNSNSNSKSKMMSFLQAYKEWIKRNGEEPRLPALNYTNEQLFFISAAQVEVGELQGVFSENTLSSFADFQIISTKQIRFCSGCRKGH